MHIVITANVHTYGMSAEEFRAEATRELSRLARVNGLPLDSLSVVVGESEERQTLSPTPKRRGFLARVFGG